MKKIFVLGSINFDLTVTAERMPQNGETVNGTDFLTNSGGKGANQAVAASKLGGDVYLIGAVGNDFFGKECLQTLRKYGVNTDFVRVADGVSTGTAIIIVQNGDNRIVVAHGANYALDKDYVLQTIATHVSAGDIFVTQMEVPADIVAAALKQAKQCGAVTILNPAPAEGVTDEILSCCDYVIPNETEAEAICGVSANGLQNLQKVDTILTDKGAKNIIVTLGGNGCYCNGSMYPVPQKVVAVDTTAAGDTFVGALCAMLAEDKPFVQAIGFCQCASAITVTRFGAQMSIPYLEEIKKIV